MGGKPKINAAHMKCVATCRYLLQPILWQVVHKAHRALSIFDREALVVDKNREHLSEFFVQTETNGGGIVEVVSDGMKASAWSKVEKVKQKKKNESKENWNTEYKCSVEFDLS